ncbi:MAG: hypothetical protein CM1200mP26_00480 [Acidimicrobiales bacterium]|nr:MAG: hypothetical protein CM1200mP26_00480 [Acidimicrobiales bacterium]
MSVRTVRFTSPQYRCVATARPSPCWPGNASSPRTAPGSEQERTYLTVFDRFARMLERGEFPYHDEERLRHRTPRVGDGLYGRC